MPDLVSKMFIKELKIYKMIMIHLMSRILNDKRNLRFPKKKNMRNNSKILKRY